LYEALVERTRGFGFVTCRNAAFSDIVGDIDQQAHTSSVFLYLDPYTPRDVDWASISKLLAHIVQRHSIELLLNLNTHAFARSAIAAVRNQSVSGAVTLDAIAGGSWWKSIVESDRPYPVRVREIRDGFCQRLRNAVRYVCAHDVWARWDHAVPKYSLIFGSRHVDAFLLINDAACGSREQLAATAAPTEMMLFETRPVKLIPEEAPLYEALLRHAREWTRRKWLVAAVAEDHFGEYATKTIRAKITELIKAGRLESGSGKHRINDAEPIRRCQ